MVWGATVKMQMFRDDVHFILIFVSIFGYIYFILCV